MCCKSFWKKAVPFATALMLSVFVTGLFQKINYQNETKVAPKAANEARSFDYETGTGDVSCSGGRGRGVEIETTSQTATTALRILSKPRPVYTDAARQNQVTGTVRLRITFLASGQIGSISPVVGLPDGLTEQAIAAAAKIKFEPQKVNGVPQTVTKQIEYSFYIY